MDKLLNVLKDRKEELYDMLSNLIKIDSEVLFYNYLKNLLPNFHFVLLNYNKS